MGEERCVQDKHVWKFFFVEYLLKINIVRSGESNDCERDKTDSIRHSLTSSQMANA